MAELKLEMILQIINKRFDEHAKQISDLQRTIKALQADNESLNEKLKWIN